MRFFSYGRCEELECDRPCTWPCTSLTTEPRPPPEDGRCSCRYRSDHDRDEDRDRQEQRAASSGGLGSVVSEVLGQVQGRSHAGSSYGYPQKRKKKESFLSDLFG